MSKKPGVVPPPEKKRETVQEEFVRLSKESRRKNPGALKPMPEKGPLVVLVDSPRGVIARSVRQCVARAFILDAKPEGPETKPLMEVGGLEAPRTITTEEAMSAAGTAIQRMGPAAMIGAIGGGLLGAFLAGQSGTRQQTPGRGGRALVNPADILGPALKQAPKPTSTVVCQGFALSEDVVAATGVSVGDAPGWACCRATLTSVWIDPYVAQEAMVRDPAIFVFLDRTGEGMREAAEKRGTFDLMKVATDVRAMLAPGR